MERSEPDSELSDQSPPLSHKHTVSDKVRIHDLAKRYGMPGKDLAARLRDFGFNQARSHMSALAPFELVQAEGILAANGILPSAPEERSDNSESVGGLKIRRKTKKKKSKEDEAPESVSAGVSGETPVGAVDAQAGAPVEADSTQPPAAGQVGIHRGEPVSAEITPAS